LFIWQERRDLTSLSSRHVSQRWRRNVLTMVLLEKRGTSKAGERRRAMLCGGRALALLRQLHCLASCPLLRFSRASRRTPFRVRRIRSHRQSRTDPTSDITTAPDSTDHPTPPNRGFGKRSRGSGRGRGGDRVNCAALFGRQVLLFYFWLYYRRNVPRNGFLYHFSIDIGRFLHLLL